MITREEYVELKELRDEYFNWLFSTSDNEIYASQEKPIKDQDIVIYGGKVKKIKNKMFTFIKWEDEKPTKILDLIQDYEKQEELKGKVQIPQFVADWIEEIKNKNCVHALEILFDTASMPAEVYDWLKQDSKNWDIMARAWLDGFIVSENAPTENNEKNKIKTAIKILEELLDE